MNKFEENRKDKLGKGMIIVLIANIISMIFNFLINFLQPKYLSVDSYASIKTFVLYLSVIGVFHLGYSDGTYLRYGGKEKENLDKIELGLNISTLRVLQFAIALIVLSVGMLINDNIVVVSACMLLPYNMVMHYRLFYQAVGDFKQYGKVMNWSTALIFIGNLILIFILKIDNFIWYLILQVIVYIALWAFLEYDIRNTLGVGAKLFSFSFHELLQNIKFGFLIMIGNFSSIFLTTIDRWFVKYLLYSVEFAQYSFAVSMEGFLNVAVSPFTITLYNYFCNERRTQKIKQMHNVILVFSVTVVATAFPFKFIVEKWLINYIDAMDVLFILFASQMFFIIIKSIYVNLYKARKQQRKYFIKLITVLISGAVFNSICYFLMRNKEAMAVGTLLSAVLWFILCQTDYSDIRYDYKHFSYLILEIMLFMVCGLFLSSILGFVIYVIGTIILSLSLVPKDVRFLFEFLIATIKGNKRGLAG